MAEAAVVESTAGYEERRWCYVCGRRRMCKFVVVGVPFGVGFFVCREHPGWEPVEGEDFKLVSEEEWARGDSI